MTDKITIHDLTLSCIIGTFPEERTRRQPIEVTIELCVDLRKAGASDNLDDTVDYFALTHSVREMAENSAFQLLEALGEKIAELALRDRRVRSVCVRLEKPEALSGARAVVELLRTPSEKGKEDRV